MAVILQVTEGPAVGRRTFLRVGQVMRIGRTEWADFNVPQDAAMAPIHFSVEYDTHICRLRDLQSGATTLVNGKPVGEAVLNHGDRITAGATTFHVHIEGAQPVVAAAATVAVAAVAAPVRKGDSGFKHVEPPTAAEVCKLFEFDDPAKALARRQTIGAAVFHALGEGEVVSPTPCACWPTLCRSAKRSGGRRARVRAGLGDSDPLARRPHCAGSGRTLGRRAG